MEYFEGREEEMNLENPIPVGFLVFAVIMIVSMFYYMYAHMPISGWTEASEYNKTVMAHHASAEAMKSEAAPEPAKAEAASNQTK